MMNFFRLLSLLASFQFVIVTAAFTDDVNQKTTGNQSSVIYAPGGTGTVNYDVSDEALEKMNSEIRRSYSEMRQSFSECINTITKMQVQKIEEFNQTLAEYISKEKNVPTATSQAWAKDILEGSSTYKEFVEENRKRQELSDKYNEQLSQNIVANSYKVFAYILETIDSSINEIMVDRPNLKLEKSPTLDLFSPFDQNKPEFNTRVISFPKGKIVFVINPGQLDKNGLVSSGPRLTSKVIDAKDEIQPFSVEPVYSGRGMTMVSVGNSLGYRKDPITFPYKNVGYQPYDSDSDALSAAFKKNFLQNFNLFMKFAWGVCNKE